MAEVVIKVEGLCKKYRLGVIGTGMLSKDLNIYWAKLRGKPHPYAKIDGDPKSFEEGDFWALKDLNFEVNQGEVLGIVGSNGAGKSTLLKILSRVTTPTLGEIKLDGRMASLLEVGTGFHPELTGRENIFLNGAILGMTKQEIRSKLDEIIAFSGVEQHIDTPVKRYSSGMYVRLAFAVAAHLEPEILVVDEVLAVGDADFQKKCLGKMRDVSRNDGRTVLFVSHSLQAVKNLCDRALWLDQGRLMDMGEVTNVVNQYASNKKALQWLKEFSGPDEAIGNQWAKVKKAQIIPQLSSPDEIFDIRTPIKVVFQFWNLQDAVRLSVELAVYAYGGECIFVVPSASAVYQKGLIHSECMIPGNLLNNGSYFISLYVVKDTTTTLFEWHECLSFDLEDYRGEIQWYGKWHGAVRPKLPFVVKPIEEHGFNLKGEI
ncbi:ABC transporter ATP-binding protein [Pararhodonellum marinum]|uniref:ABC transporter ATP-binding protein n=1 Tax=Pararhodonellum marinum TaxID=2755358 RepID=UPI00188FB34A|nr:ABC transporter ATP-binding protein [Pararhodonellum marinum]